MVLWTPNMNIKNHQLPGSGLCQILKFASPGLRILYMGICPAPHEVVNWEMVHSLSLLKLLLKLIFEQV